MPVTLVGPVNSEEDMAQGVLDAAALMITSLENMRKSDQLEFQVKD